MSEERRESYRCPVQPEMDTAALRTSRGDVMVRVLEESAGGFTISGDKPQHMKRLRVGQLMTMVAASGCCEVKAVHITQGEDGTRVGLQRLREVPQLGGGISTKQVAAMVALVIAVFAMGIYIPEHWKPQPAALAQGKWRLPEKEDGSPPEDPAETRKKLADDYLKLGNLQSPEYTRELGLSADQQQAISGIVAETSQELAQLYKQRTARKNAAKGETPEPDWSNNGLKLMQASWDRIQEVMTPQQREKLHQIMLTRRESSAL